MVGNFNKGDEILPGYRLDWFLGRGQFGEVWRATAPGGTSIALKVINLGGKQGLKELRGIQRVKEIRHANLMPITSMWMLDRNGRSMDENVIDSFNTQDIELQETLSDNEKPRAEPERPRWLVVAMMLGDESLQDALETKLAEGEEGIPQEELLNYLEDAAKGIDFLNTTRHDLGEGNVSIQHCDIKPANMMIVGNSVVVCDFGLARMLGDVQVTATGMIGSPAYMAPECIRRKPSSASDQYSLAVTYYELRTGNLPFVDQSYMAVLDAHSQGTLDFSLASEREQAILKRATSLSPEDRFPTTLEFIRALKSNEESVPAEISPPVNIPLKSMLGLGLCGLGAAFLFAFLVWLTGAPPLTKKIEVVPATATVRVNGTAVPVTNGQFEVTLEDSATNVVIEVSNKPEYEDLSLTFNREEFTAFSKPIELPTTVVFHLKQAEAAIKADDEPRAVRQLELALEMGHQESPATETLWPLSSEVAEDLEVSSGRAALLVVPTDAARMLVVALDSGHVVVWDDATKEDLPRVFSVAENELTFCVADAGGRRILAGNEETFATIQIPATGQATLKRFQQPEGDVITGAISPDGRLFLLGTDSDKIYVYDNNQTTDQEPIQLAANGQVNQLVFADDSQSFVSTTLAGELIRWTVGEIAESLSVDSFSATQLGEGLPFEPGIVRLTEDAAIVSARRHVGDELVYPVGVFGFDGRLAQLNSGHTDWIHGLTITADKRLVVSGGDDGDLRGWTLVPSQADVLVPTGQSLTAVAAVGASAYVAAGTESGVLLLTNLTSEVSSPPRLLTLDQHTSAVHALVAAEELGALYSASFDGTIRIWNLKRLRIHFRATELLLQRQAEKEATST